MNKITLAFLSFLCLLFVSPFSFGPTEEPITVCEAPATEAFANLADDPEFVKAHHEPEHINFKSINGTAITFDTPDGQKGNAYLVKKSETTKNYLFVIHEWWGLNDHIRQEAEQLFTDLGDVNVLALDMYDGKFATTRPEASKLMQGVKTARAEAIIQGALAYAGEDARIFTIGWCFGGGWSLKASLLVKDQAAGCVIYYGMPVQDVEKLKTLQADVLGIWAGREGWINKDVVAKFEKNMEAAGKKLDSNSYDAEHAFANPSAPIYDEASAKDAYAKTLNFLKTRIK